MAGVFSFKRYVLDSTIVLAWMEFNVTHVLLQL
jgi:hypothetical protein